MDKQLAVANFNITYGNTDEPMLDHFFDFIFPAFQSTCVRRVKSTHTEYFFNDICIKEFEDEYVLVGNVVKDTVVEVETRIHDGVLTPHHAKVPTAPYSRFMIFLRNHRMILVKNQPTSPDIRSFTSLVKTVLRDFRNNENRKRKQRNQNDLLPIANINIVAMPMQEEIKEFLCSVSKIKWVRFRLFPLNNDKEREPFTAFIKDTMKDIGSKRASVEYRRPESREAVGALIEQNRGLASVSMEVEDDSGMIKRVSSNEIRSRYTIPIDGNIGSKEDWDLFMHGKDIVALQDTSAENNKLFAKCRTRLFGLLHHDGA